MGVPELWELILPGADERIPFKLFVSNFFESHRRPVRVAIDAYTWIFEGNLTPGLQGETQAFKTAKLAQSFHARIRDLIQLNISFVMVFDGKFKPKFKRNFRALPKDSSSYDYYSVYEEFSSYCKNGCSFDFDEYIPEVKVIQEYLDLWNITYITAASEGEAECAKLQAAGVVDYVITNDADVFLFGATKVLRNFSKIVEDKPPSGSKTNTPEIYVTPISASKVVTRTGLDRFCLMLIAILRGGDYSSGVTNIGSTKANYIALSGSKFGVYHPKSSPDHVKVKFIENFKDCFLGHRMDYISGTLPSKSSISLQYDKFQNLLRNEIENFPYEYFGRNGKSSYNDFPPIDIALLYFYPLLAPGLFKFMPGTTNFSEFIDEDKSKIPYLPLPFTIQVGKNSNELVVRRSAGSNGQYDYFIGETIFKRQKNEIDWELKTFTTYSREISFKSSADKFFSEPKFRSMLSKIKGMPFPGVNENVEAWLTKTLSQAYWSRLYSLDTTLVFADKYKQLMYKTNGSDGKFYESCMIRIRLDKFKEIFQSTENKTKHINDGDDYVPNDDAKLVYVWVPKALVYCLHPEIISEYDTRLKEKLEKSIKVKKRQSTYSQKTTLASLGFLSCENKYSMPSQSFQKMKFISSEKLKTKSPVRGNSKTKNKMQQNQPAFDKKTQTELRFSDIKQQASELPKTPKKRNSKEILPLFLGDSDFSDDFYEDSPIKQIENVSPNKVPFTYQADNSPIKKNIIFNHKEKTIQSSAVLKKFDMETMASLKKKISSQDYTSSDSSDNNSLLSFPDEVLTEFINKKSYNLSKGEASPSKNLESYSNYSIDKSPSKRTNISVNGSSHTDKKFRNTNNFKPISPSKEKRIQTLLPFKSGHIYQKVINPTKAHERESEGKKIITTHESSTVTDGIMNTSTPATTSIQSQFKAVHTPKKRNNAVKLLNFSDHSMDDDCDVVEIHEDTFYRNTKKNEMTQVKNFIGSRGKDILDDLLEPLIFSSDDSD